NYWCARDDRGFDAVWSVARHEGMMREAIAKYKYRGAHHWGAVFGLAVAAFLDANMPAFDDVQLIVAAPSHHADDQSERGTMRAVLEVAAAVAGDRWCFDVG